MAKKYGPNEEFEIDSKVKFKKNDISNKMPMADIEKKISEFGKDIESSKD